MKRLPWLTLLLVFAVTTVLIVARQGAGLTGPPLVVAAISAFAACVGALVAPAVYGPPRPTAAEYRGRKACQIVSAGLVTSVVAWLGLMEPPIAAIIGIAAALGVGAVLPRDNATRDESTAA